MRQLFIVLICLYVTPYAVAQGTKQITLEDIWKNNTFRMKDVPGFKAMKDGKHYSQIDRHGDTLDVNIYNLETGKFEKTVFSNATLKTKIKKSVRVDDYAFS